MKKILFILGFVVFVNQYFAQNVGIGTTTPANKLHVVGAGGLDPLRVDGLNMFVSEQNILVVDPVAGIVRYMHIDSLQARLDTTDFNALLTYIRDSLLNDSVFMDSINTDDQNLTLSNDTLYIEDGNWVVLNFSMDTNLIDSLIYAKLDTFYTIISDSLLLDSTWLFKLDSLINSDTIYFNDTSYTLLRDSLLGDSLFRDSIDTDIDSIKFINDTLYLYEDDKIVSVLINPSLDTSLVDSLIYAKFDSVYNYISDSLLLDSVWLATLDSLLRDSIFFNDTSFTLYRDSLIRDSLFLQALRDSIETNIDTGYLLTFDTLILIEDTDTLSIPLDCKNEGRILYVSTEGNNQTAQIGKRCYPFRDPWTAKDSAQAGDVIHVLPGSYTTGDIGSGADRESNGANLDTTSLMKDSVSYYFEVNCKIMHLNSPTGLPLFYDTNGSFTSVSGLGSFYYNSTNNSAIVLGDTNSNLEINFNYFESQNNGFTPNGPFKRFVFKGNNVWSENRFLNINGCDRINNSTGIVNINVSEEYAINARNWELIRSVNNYHVDESYGYFNSGGYDIVTNKNLIHNFKARKFSHKNRGEVNGINTGNTYGFWAMTCDSNSVLNYDVDLMVASYMHVKLQHITQEYSGARINIHIDECIQDSTTITNNDRSCIVIQGSSNTINKPTRLSVSGNFTSLMNRSLVNRFSGQNNLKLHINNAKLITDFTNSITSVSVFSGILIQNVVSNKPVDANTVLTGQPITVDPNYE